MTSPGSRALALLVAAAFVPAALVFGRMAYDLARLGPALALVIGPFYAAFLVLAGANTLALLRGSVEAPPLGGGVRLGLALAIPAALVASMLDCMGLAFDGCTTWCTLQMRGVAPVLGVLALVHGLAGGRGLLVALLAGSLLLLVPNCVCRNPVNRWWIDLLGQSPACFGGSFALVQVALGALLVRRRAPAALALAWGGVAAMLGFWVGHHYFRWPW
jgi:hypothetical protein